MRESQFTFLGLTFNDCSFTREFTVTSYPNFDVLLSESSTLRRWNQ
jgi:hypothetical protein